MNSFRSIEETDKFAASSFCPENLRDLGESPNARLCTEILSELKESLITSQKRSKKNIVKYFHKFRRLKKTPGKADFAETSLKSAKVEKIHNQ